MEYPWLWDRGEWVRVASLSWDTEETEDERKERERYKEIWE